MARTRRRAPAAPPTPPVAASWLSQSWRRAVLVTVGVLAFATALGAPFFLDDGEAIERNP